MKVKYDNPVRTNVTKEVKEEIDKYCEEKGVRLSDFLRDAIEFYLKKSWIKVCKIAKETYNASKSESKSEYQKNI